MLTATEIQEPTSRALVFGACSLIMYIYWVLAMNVSSPIAVYLVPPVQIYCPQPSQGSRNSVWLGRSVSRAIQITGCNQLKRCANPLTRRHRGAHNPLRIINSSFRHGYPARTRYSQPIASCTITMDGSVVITHAHRSIPLHVRPLSAHISEYLLRVAFQRNHEATVIDLPALRAEQGG